MFRCSATIVEADRESLHRYARMKFIYSLAARGNEFDKKQISPNARTLLLSTQFCNIIYTVIRERRKCERTNICVFYGRAEKNMKMFLNIMSKAVLFFIRIHVALSSRINLTCKKKQKNRIQE